MIIFIEIFFLAGLAIIGVREPIRKKWWKELVVFIILFLFGASLMLLQAAGVKLPFIVDSIESFFKNVLHFKY